MSLLGHRVIHLLFKEGGFRGCLRVVASHSNSNSRRRAVSWDVQSRGVCVCPYSQSIVRSRHHNKKGNRYHLAWGLRIDFEQPRPQKVLQEPVKNIIIFPLLVLKGTYHYWTYFFIFPRGRKSNWKPRFFFPTGSNI